MKTDAAQGVVTQNIGKLLGKLEKLFWDAPYASPNWYFVTICTKLKRQMFVPKVSEKYGDLLPKNVAAPNNVAAGPWPAYRRQYATIVEQKLLTLEEKFPVEIDFYCIMPDHIHFIIDIFARQGRAATTFRFPAHQGPAATISLSWILNAFKGWCTREIGKSIWQPNFYEHIIRSESSLDRIRNYILNNPFAEYREIVWDTLDSK